MMTARPIRQFHQVVLLLFSLICRPEICRSKLQSSSLSSNPNHPDETSNLNMPPTFTLSNNITIPMVGLGSASGVSYPHVATAIESGYRFVDTAQSHSWGYREEEVGRAVFDKKGRWEDHFPTPNDHPSEGYVFVQTKIHPKDLGYHATRRAIEISLQRLQSSSLDSVLIHKPHCWGDICPQPPEGTWHDSWDALQEAYDDGIVRSIGICDVDLGLLSQLRQKRVHPTIIQNWFDPFHQDKKVREKIRSINEQLEKEGKIEGKILYQGYSSLGTQWFHHKGYTENPVLNNPTLKSIAAKHGATVPQVVIQWATRNGVMVLPASRSTSHQMSNLNSFFFSLTEEDMRAIDDLDGNPPPSPKKEVDPNQVQVQFVNRAELPIDVYWVPDGKLNDDSISDHVHVGDMKGLGDVLKLTSYHGHTFLFREAGGEGKKMNVHVMDRALGGKQHHDIEDQSDEL
mmetsp:Transcript_22121/g.42321  ORF Transcript_22121/g.42321 Transcript_22121/m.42321 type:complete len:457 (-) Transcript_22121:37-1407(-)